MKHSIEFYEELLRLNEMWTRQAIKAQDFDRVQDLSLHRQLVKTEIIKALKLKLETNKKGVA